MAKNYIVKVVIAALLVFSCVVLIHTQTNKTDQTDQTDEALRARESDLDKLELQINSLGTRRPYGDVTYWIVPENCAVQIPLLDQGISMSKPQAEWSPAWQRRFADVRQDLLVQRAYCALSENDDEKAVKLFEEMVAVSIAYREGISSQALACLAHAYATGKGVQADPFRAIGYYAALPANNKGYYYGSGDVCGDLGSYFPDVPREVAEAVISQDPTAQRDSGSLVYQFLRRGTTRDYLTAVKLFDAAHEKSYEKGYSEWRDLYRLALDGLPRSIAGFDEDAAAKSELNYKLGEWSMEQTWLVHTQALTYSFLLDANSPAAREKLEQAYAKTPFTLILLDGREWSPSNAP